MYHTCRLTKRMFSLAGWYSKRSEWNSAQRCSKRGICVASFKFVQYYLKSWSHWLGLNADWSQICGRASDFPSLYSVSLLWWCALSFNRSFRQRVLHLLQHTFNLEIHLNLIGQGFNDECIGFIVSRMRRDSFFEVCPHLSHHCPHHAENSNLLNLHCLWACGSILPGWLEIDKYGYCCRVIIHLGVTGRYHLYSWFLFPGNVHHGSRTRQPPAQWKVILWSSVWAFEGTQVLEI